MLGGLGPNEGAHPSRTLCRVTQNDRPQPPPDAASDAARPTPPQQPDTGKEPGSTVKDAVIAAVGFAAAVVSFISLSWQLAAVALGVVCVVLAALMPRRSSTAWLYAIAAVLVATGAIGSLASGAAARREQLATQHMTASTSAWDSQTPGLGSVSTATGFYPARPALVCSVPATCNTGPLASLDSLVFQDGSVPQGAPDERRFLGAQEVGSGENLRPLQDPLVVHPGETIRISGFVDNSASGLSPQSTAHGVRAIVLLPHNTGKKIVLLSALSSIDASPPVVSDSVTIDSPVPIYLRYEPSLAYAIRGGHALYHLPGSLATEYEPSRLDRRTFAGQGVLIGCHRADGLVPSRRQCAFSFQALFTVHYAATSEDENGLSPGLGGYPDEDIVRVRGIEDSFFLNWEPRKGTEGVVEVKNGHLLALDCALYDGRTLWDHVAATEVPGDPNEGGEEEGIETGFIEAAHVTRPPKPLEECDS